LDECFEKQALLCKGKRKRLQRINRLSNGLEIAKKKGEKNENNIFCVFIEGLDRNPEFGPEETRGYILLLADSILLMAPQVDIPQDIQSEMKEGVAAYRNVENVILQEDSVDLLWKAARFLNPDFDLNFPENPTPELIKEDVRPGFAGFIEKMHVPEAYLAIVASPEDPDGTKLLLEPNDNPIAKTYQEGIYKSGLPVIVFGVEDIHGEYERLKKLGVVFKQEPTERDWGIDAIFDDTCGNFIMLLQAKK